MPIKPPAFPLNTAAFVSALRTGHGRAQQQVDGHGSSGLEGQIIEALDGMDGLMHVARQLGRWLQADPDFRVNDDLVVQFDESTGVEGGWAALEREAALDPDVARYVVSLHKTREGRSGTSSGFDPTVCTGAEIVAYVNHAPKDECHWFSRWGAHATNDQREAVFAALLATDK